MSVIDVSKFYRVKIPKLIAKEIIEVQPMMAPEINWISWRLEAKERKLKPGWKMEQKGNGDFRIFYEDTMKDFLGDEDFLL